MEAVRVALGDLAVEPRASGSVAASGSAPSGYPSTVSAVPPPGVPSVRHSLGPLPGEPVTEQIPVVPSDRARPGRPRRRRRLRPRWIAALTALVLIAAGAGTWALVHGVPGSHARTAAVTSISPKMKKPQMKKPHMSALMSALALADKSSDAKGQLPPSSCVQQGATRVICTNPALGISQAVFQTYSSLTTLYDAYVAAVRTLDNGQFQANFNDCGKQLTFGEVSWNHMFEHPKSYSVSQMSSGMVPDSRAAGRVFCNFSSGQENMVWTQNDGRLLASVSGPVHEDVWTWWVAVHHNIGLAGQPMHM
jgi:hypothetical protein